MVDAGLLGRFVEFWQAYADRDWLRRRKLDSVPASMADSFYVGYHSKAWPLKAIEIIRVDADTDAIRLQMNLSLVNPEKGAVEVHYRAETWNRSAAGWVHVNQDPLFSPARQ